MMQPTNPWHSYHASGLAALNFEEWPLVDVSMAASAASPTRNTIQLLDRANAKYEFEKAADKSFTASVTVGDHVGTAAGDTPASALSFARTGPAWMPRSTLGTRLRWHISGEPSSSECGFCLVVLRRFMAMFTGRITIASIEEICQVNRARFALPSRSPGCAPFIQAGLRANFARSLNLVATW